MEILYWIVIVLLFLLSFIGIIFPLIPSSLAIWAGFLLYHFLLDNMQLTAAFFISMAVLTLLIIAADILANRYFVKKFGGSKSGEYAGAAGVIAGSFIMPPLGIILVPFITVFIAEFIQHGAVRPAFRASIGSIIGFLGGTLAKVFIQLVMITWFFIVIIF